VDRHERQHGLAVRGRPGDRPHPERRPDDREDEPVPDAESGSVDDGYELVTL
jgi:hypothetical protein